MKKYILKSLVFGLIIISIMQIITSIINHSLRKSESGNLKEWNEIFEGNINAQLLIQGSSRAWVQYSTYIIDSELKTNSYNLGMDGSPFDVQYIRYFAYEQNNKLPKIIIQNVDLDLLDANKFVFQKYQFLPYLNNKPFRNLLLDHQIVDYYDCTFPFITYAGQPKAYEIALSELLGIKHQNAVKHKGYAGQNAEWNGNNFEFRKNQGVARSKINGNLEKLFVQFLDECQKKKILVVLVYAPMYYEMQQLISNFSSSRLYYKTLSERHNLLFLDYSSSYISKEKKYFYNATHLNAKGSEAFTKLLVNDLKQYLDSTTLVEISN